jgi:undecaprenyl-diphosphatase
MTLLEVIILAFIEGLTEFIPVSSTGHLILTSAALNIPNSDFIKAFNVIIQFGAILAVVYLYWKKLKWDYEFYKNVTLAFIPTAILGFLFKNKVDELMESTAVVAYALIVGGVVLIWIDSLFKSRPNKELNSKSSLLIGVFQSLAMIPGVSRSAATIIGGQLFGLTREKAAEFSFILAIPTLGAATLYKLWKIRGIIESSHMVNLSLGVFMSFIFSVLAIKFFISFITKYGFKIFGYYRIVLGAVVLFFHSKGLI